MKKTALIFALLLGCIGLYAQNYNINLHRSGSVIYSEDVNNVSTIRFEGSQTQQSIQGRHENVEGVFELCRKADVQGKHILLIDDIVTSGATIVSCANELRKGGAAHFSVLSLGFAKH